MKRFVLAFLFGWLFTIAIGAADSKSPRLTAVEPDSGKAGDSATAKGENLEKDIVADLYLTDGKNDVKAEITARTGDSITFKVPNLKPGRYRLMTGSRTAMIEQPVMFEVSEP
jgi:hypothetical protein